MDNCLICGRRDHLYFGPTIKNGKMSIVYREGFGKRPAQAYCEDCSRWVWKRFENLHRNIIYDTIIDV